MSFLSAVGLVVSVIFAIAIVLAILGVLLMFIDSDVLAKFISIIIAIAIVVIAMILLPDTTNTLEIVGEGALAIGAAVTFGILIGVLLEAFFDFIQVKIIKRY